MSAEALLASTLAGPALDVFWSAQERNKSLTDCMQAALIAESAAGQGNAVYESLPHINALCTVIQRPIHVVYPNVNGALRPFLNVQLEPLRSSAHPPVSIMWTSAALPRAKKSGFVTLNHFVALVDCSSPFSAKNTVQVH